MEASSSSENTADAVGVHPLLTDLKGD